MKKLALLVGLLAAFGAHAQEDPTDACLAQLEHDSRLALIIPRIGSPVAGDKFTLEMQASQDKASEAEKPVLSLWASARRDCFRQGDAYRAQFPEIAAVYNSAQSRLLDAISDLWSGGQTWGQFVKQRRRLSEDVARELPIALARVRERAMSQQAEAERFRQPAPAAAATYQPIPMPKLEFRPIYVPQQPAFNCTTTQFGGQLQTRCQ